MTEEEKKAIEYLKKYINWETYGERKLEEDIETVLNLIQKQQEEIEEQDITIDRLTKEQEEREKNTHTLEAELKKKDKIIDMMSYAMTHEEIPQDEYCIIRTMACEVVGGNGECKQCIKQYFEKKAEEN